MPNELTPRLPPLLRFLTFNNHISVAGAPPRRIRAVDELHADACIQESTYARLTALP
jgi:hypothetical protein